MKNKIKLLLISATTILGLVGVGALSLNPVDDAYQLTTKLDNKDCVRVNKEAQYDSNNGKIYFEGDSDAIIVRGIIAIVLEIFKDKTAKEILNIDVEKIFDTIGLREHITSNRRSGMLSMVDKIKYYANLADKDT